LPKPPPPPGRRADIWSLGCTVLEMLTGQHPWPDLDNHWSAMFAIARSTEGPPRPAGMSATALDFLDCCLQVDPAQRPTATELLQHPWVATADAARREAAGEGGGGGGNHQPASAAPRGGASLNHSF
jgi:serine/threonine protein kinase